MERHSPFVVYGAGGHARSVAEAVRATGRTVHSYIDDVSLELPDTDAPVFGSVIDALDEGNVDVALAIGDNFQRALAWKRVLSLVTVDRLPSIVHPKAVVASSVIVGPGTVVMAGAVIGSGVVLGTGVVVNTGAIIDHECQLADFSSVGPGAVLAGRVLLGERSIVAIGAVVRENRRIGHDALLGSASYLHQDLDPRAVAYGVPARHIRDRVADEPYLK